MTTHEHDLTGFTPMGGGWYSAVCSVCGSDVIMSADQVTEQIAEQKR